MKTLITFILIAFTLSCKSQIIPVNIQGQTAYVDITTTIDSLADAFDQKLLDYVTGVELATALDTLSVDGVMPDSVLTTQDLIDFYDFAAYDSAMFVFDKILMDTTFIPVGDTFSRVYLIQDGDTLYRQLDPDWDNWAKWYDTYRMQIFPTNFDYGWGETNEE